MKKFLLVIGLLVGSFLANGQTFTAGNIAVLRVGNGTSTLNSNALPVSIVEYGTDGVASGSSIAVPSTTGGNRLVLNAAVTSLYTEGALRLSANGQYLVFGGYDAAVGTSATNTSGGVGVGATNVFARLAADGTLDLSTKFTFVGKNGIRSVVSNDGTGFWASCANADPGLIYIPLGSTTYTTLVATSYRSALITGGQLYAVSGSLSTIGSGLPQIAVATTNGNSFTGANPYGFTLFDMSDAEPGFDVIYIADQSGTAGIRKYSKVAGVWTDNGSLDVAAFANAPTTDPGKLLDITGSLNSSSQPVLYATRGTGENNSVITITDPNGYNTDINFVAPTFAHLASAGTKYTFRGVAFTPGTIRK